MDWGKAKNYIILFLMVFNLFLFVCNILSDRKYTIGTEQSDAIKTIMEKKNITLSSEIPVDYKPMQQINFSECSYDEINIQKIFFSDSEDIQRSSDFMKTLLISGDKKVSIYPDRVEFESSNIDLTSGFTEKNVTDICDGYVDKVSDYYSGLTKYKADLSSDGLSYQVEYIQKYKGKLIFNNHILFNVYKSGTIKAEMSYFPIKGYGSTVDICSADEALFIFAGKVDEIFVGQSVSIKRIEKGYYFGDFEKGSNIVATPYYRIEVSGTDQMFFINAYNRTLVTREYFK